MALEHSLVPSADFSSVFSSRPPRSLESEEQHSHYEDYSEYGTAHQYGKRSSERVIRNIVLGSIITMAAEGGIAIAAMMSARNANKVLAASGLSSLYLTRKTKRTAGISGWLALAAVHGTYGIAVALLKLYARRPELFQFSD